MMLLPPSDKPFKPVALYNQGMDCIIYLTEDVPYVLEYNPKDLIQIMRHEGRVVGFQIDYPSEWVKLIKNENKRSY